MTYILRNSVPQTRSRRIDILSLFCGAIFCHSCNVSYTKKLHILYYWKNSPSPFCFASKLFQSYRCHTMLVFSLSSWLAGSTCSNLACIQNHNSCGFYMCFTQKFKNHTPTSFYCCALAGIHREVLAGLWFWFLLFRLAPLCRGHINSKRYEQRTQSTTSSLTMQKIDPYTYCFTCFCLVSSPWFLSCNSPLYSLIASSGLWVVVYVSNTVDLTRELCSMVEDGPLEKNRRQIQQPNTCLVCCVFLLSNSLESHLVAHRVHDGFAQDVWWTKQSKRDIWASSCWY
jgi:hypothetical protein